MAAGTMTIDEAVRTLRAGGVLGMPTETVYGLAADARRDAAVSRIFALKGRPSTNPLIVHVASVEVAERYAVVSDTARLLFARFAPGPLTIVLPRRSFLPLPLAGRGRGEGQATAGGDGRGEAAAGSLAPLPSPPPRAGEGTGGIVSEVTAGLDTVGVRIPAHPVALAMLRAFDGPLAAPSANKSNGISPTTAAHVREAFGDEVPVLDGGPCDVGLESTVLDLTREPPTILRPGGISREAIEAIIGPVGLFTGHVAANVAAASPGQSATHYAPRAPAWWFDREVVQVVAQRATERSRVLCIGSIPTSLAAVERACRVLEGDASRAGQAFYAALRELDAAAPDAIYIELPPDEPQWTALRDRILRAARPL